MQAGYQEFVKSTKLQNTVTQIKILKYHKGFTDLDDSWEDHVALHKGIKLVGGHEQIGHLRSDRLDGLWG
jgi:hypothetical protein